MKLGLKVDVDTFVGARDGIPRLLSLFADFEVAATFFPSLGPDNSGRALRRVLTRPGFLRKMRNSKAPSLYPPRTLLSGTLLPPPCIALRLSGTLRDIASAGHEVGLHAWDHVHWHDHLPGMTPANVREQLGLGCNAFQRVFGFPPPATAAPGWTCTGESLRALDELGCRYHSNTRGVQPCRPRMEGYTATTLELPTTLPTMDELLGDGLSPDACLQRLSEAPLAPAYNVFTLHTEVEGGPCLPVFRRLLQTWRARGVRLCPLQELADEVEEAPVIDAARGSLPGRGGWVTMTGSAT